MTILKDNIFNSNYKTGKHQRHWSLPWCHPVFLEK